MPSLSLTDLASRTKPMAEEPKKKKKWIKGAIKPSHKGEFKAKAEAAGKTTAEYANEKAGAPGSLGKEARLAETLMGMHKKKSRRETMYDHPRSRHNG